MGRLKSLVVLLALLAVACGQTTTSSEPGPVGTAADGAYKAITVSELKAMLDKKDFVLVNVHIPYAGEIQGTDLFLPYDTVEKNLAKLPADKGAKIVIYCRSGNMSKIAVLTLDRLGYTNVLDVTGGMEMWVESGYALATNSPAK